MNRETGRHFQQKVEFLQKYAKRRLGALCKLFCMICSILPFLQNSKIPCSGEATHLSERSRYNPALLLHHQDTMLNALLLNLQHPGYSPKFRTISRKFWLFDILEQLLFLRPLEHLRNPGRFF